MELQHETVLKAEPIEPEELVSEVSFPDPVFQWVECVSESYYNENGNLISTKHTTYFQPPKQIYEIPELMNVLCPDLTVMIPEPVQEKASTCEAKEESDAEETPEDEDGFVYRITPKGCMLLAMMNAGMAEDIDDPRLDEVWADFEHLMSKSHYLISDYAAQQT